MFSALTLAFFSLVFCGTTTQPRHIFEDSWETKQDKIFSYINIILCVCHLPLCQQEDLHREDIFAGHWTVHFDVRCIRKEELFRFLLIQSHKNQLKTDSLKHRLRICWYIPYIFIILWRTSNLNSYLRYTTSNVNINIRAQRSEYICTQCIGAIRFDLTRICSYAKRIQQRGICTFKYRHKHIIRKPRSHKHKVETNHGFAVCNLTDRDSLLLFYFEYISLTRTQSTRSHSYICIF